MALTDCGATAAIGNVVHLSTGSGWSAARPSRPIAVAESLLKLFAP